MAIELEKPGHENPVEEIVEHVEEIFLPKPGGIIDRHRQAEARREAAAQEAENAATPIEQRSYKGVKVTVVSPEIIATNVIQIPAGGTAMILPNSPYRSRAWIVVSANVLLAKDNSQALGQVGFPLTATTPPFLVTSRAQLYAYAAGATTVSVFTESYGPENA